MNLFRSAFLLTVLCVLAPAALSLSLAIPVNGNNVVFVAYPSGSFELQGDTWIERKADGRPAFYFSENGRDEGSVYLYDQSRNVHLQLDLVRWEIFYAAGNDPLRPLYTITDAQAGRSPGFQQPQPSQYGAVPAPRYDAMPAQPQTDAYGVVPQAQSGAPPAPRYDAAPAQNTAPAQGRAKLLGPFSLRGVDTGGFLANSNGQLGLSGEPTNRSAGWLIEPVGNSEPPEFVRLKSRATGDYLHVENPSPMVGPIEPGWWSAMWVMQKVGDGFTFRNRWKENHYLFGLPGRQPTVGPLQAGVSAARWALAATPPDNSALAAQPGAASAAPQVSVIVQNWSGAPLDIFLEVGPGDLGYVESLQANQEIALPSQPGMRWQLAQYEQWVGAFTATAQSQQIVPYGR